jgi:hypothetical protein
LSTGQINNEAAFETRDFYLACFLRCTGYDLIDLRPEGRRKVFVFRDRPTRRNDVLAFYGQGAAVPPLAFSAIIKDMKGSAAQCITNRPEQTPACPVDRNSVRRSIASCRSSSKVSVTVISGV